MFAWDGTSSCPPSAISRNLDLMLFKFKKQNSSLFSYETSMELQLKMTLDRSH